MVAIDGSGQSEYLVRVGKDLADRQQAAWAVVNVETGTPPDETRQVELDRAFALARQLGGEAVILHGASIADALLALSLIHI